MNSDNDNDAASILGVWILRAFHLDDQLTGQRTEPMGSAPCGVIMLHPEGRMMALLTPGDQARPATTADQASAYQSMIAYSGRYRLEPPNRFVTTVDIAWFPTWIGTDLARSYELDGDSLKIITVPGKTPRTGDAIVVGTLDLVRE